MENLQKEPPAPSFTLKSYFGFRVVISVLLNTCSNHRDFSAWGESLPLPAARLNFMVRSTNAKATSWQTLRNEGKKESRLEIKTVAV